MNDRDTFAAHALQGILASGAARDWKRDHIAKDAYAYADAMREAESSENAGYVDDAGRIIDTYGVPVTYGSLFIPEGQLPKAKRFGWTEAGRTKGNVFVTRKPL